MQQTAFDPGRASPEVSDFFKVVAKDNLEAVQFLTLWHAYCHEVDDVIDNETWGVRSLLPVFIRACEVYSTPFYRRHAVQLQASVLVATCTYGDSVKWEKDKALWKRQWADVMRHAGNEVICAVAMLCGGYEHLASVSASLRAMCYVYHADKYGVPQ